MDELEGLPRNYEMIAKAGDSRTLMELMKERTRRFPDEDTVAWEARITLSVALQRFAQDWALTHAVASPAEKAMASMRMKLQSRALTALAHRYYALASPELNAVDAKLADRFVVDIMHRPAAGAVFMHHEEGMTDDPQSGSTPPQN